MAAAAPSRPQPPCLGSFGTQVYICVYKHISICVYIYTYTYIYMYRCCSACKQKCALIHTHTEKPIYASIFRYIYIYTSIYIYVYIHICMYTYMYIYIYVYIIYIHMFMYIVEHGLLGTATSPQPSASVHQPGLLGTDLGITQRLQCRSFLVMAYFLLRDYNVVPRKELRSSLSVFILAHDSSTDGSSCASMCGSVRTSYTVLGDLCLQNHGFPPDLGCLSRKYIQYFPNLSIGRLLKFDATFVLSKHVVQTIDGSLLAIGRQDSGGRAFLTHYVERWNPIDTVFRVSNILCRPIVKTVLMCFGIWHLHP